jgi:hypothetical protein
MHLCLITQRGHACHSEANVPIVVCLNLGMTTAIETEGLPIPGYALLTKPEIFWLLQETATCPNPKPAEYIPHHLSRHILIIYLSQNTI